jgi:hypothetical protein
VSCEKNGRRCSDAAKINGISGHISRYLNVIGSLGTYLDLNNVEDVPERIAQITATFFGIKGLVEGHPRLVGVLGILIGVQAMEHVTGGMATTGMRMWIRGKPVGHYRGIVLRKSPFTPKVADLWHKAIGGRVLDSNGYYFFKDGRTYHCQSLTFQLGDMPRTLTKITSYSIPHREYYFDRPLYVQGIDPDPVDGDRVVSMQRIVDMVIGDENPESIPGFIGHVTEFEDATGMLGHIKRLFFMSNWLLIDPGERDSGSVDFVDYEAFAKGLPPGSSRRAEAGYYQVNKTAPVNSPQPVPNLWPTTSRQRYPSASTPPSPPLSTAQGYGTNLFHSVQAAAPMSGMPISLSSVPARLNVAGKEYPLIVKRVASHPFNNARRADAIYYDDAIKQWREVVDDATREDIARAVDQGTISITDQNLWPNHQIYY